jgi:DNA polymerase III subunit chi
MAEIGFYHLQATPLERALPKLLERACAQGHRVVVRTGSAARAEHLDAVLWRYDEASFLPHGADREGNPTEQPIWLTHRDENPNGASMLVLVDGVEAADWSGFARGADLFDGSDAAAVELARARWRNARAAGHLLTYWRQTASGWERKA